MTAALAAVAPTEPPTDPPTEPRPADERIPTPLISRNHGAEGVLLRLLFPAGPREPSAADAAAGALAWLVPAVVPLEFLLLPLSPVDDAHLDWGSTLRLGVVCAVAAVLGEGFMLGVVDAYLPGLSPVYLGSRRALWLWQAAVTGSTVLLQAALFVCFGFFPFNNLVLMSVWLLLVEASLLALARRRPSQALADANNYMSAVSVLATALVCGLVVGMNALESSLARLALSLAFDLAVAALKVFTRRNRVVDEEVSLCLAELWLDGACCLMTFFSVRLLSPAAFAALALAQALGPCVLAGFSKTGRSRRYRATRFGLACAMNVALAMHALLSLWAVRAAGGNRGKLSAGRWSDADADKVTRYVLTWAALFVALLLAARKWFFRPAWGEDPLRLVWRTTRRHPAIVASSLGSAVSVTMALTFQAYQVLWWMYPGTGYA